jgi:hypothetical protein
MVDILFKKALADAPQGGPLLNDDFFKSPIKYDSFVGLLKGISGELFWIAVPLVTLMVLYGSFQILTAAGNPERLEQGKKTIFYAVIGFVVFLIASGIPNLIKSLVGVK